MNIFYKVFNLLTLPEKKKSFLLLLMIVLMGFLDTAGLVSILPFLTILSNPDLIETNNLLNIIFEYTKTFGVQNKEQFLFFLGVVIFLFFIFSLSFKALTSYAMARFTQIREYSIGKRLIESYLHQPYSWFLNKHSANLGKNILSEVENVVNKGINSILVLVSQSVVVLFIVIILMITDIFLALTLFFILGTMYVIISIITKNKVKNLGKVSFKANEDRYTVIAEAFGASKEVKVGNLEKAFISKFNTPSFTYATSQATLSILMQMPRFILEGIGFGGMLIVTLYLMSFSDNFGSTVPIITLYAFAAYRLMPAIQQIFVAFGSLRYVQPAIDAVSSDLENLKNTVKYFDKTNKILLNQSIVLNNIKYYYPNTSKPVLKNINIEILSNNTVGIIGPTGSGKTTVVDLVLGLLEPNEGSLTVDDQLIDNHNRSQWQNSIGYIPQHIYLADDTIYNNIAFGLEYEKIDKQAVELAAKSANLHDFICNELTLGYNTKIGERGVRLSGGQRQRIGIARALYHNPQVLIMDEATSALDNFTEQLVMDALNNLGKNKTIIIIAHRLNTLRECDKIFIMGKGEITASGTYEELKSNNKYFKEAVNKK